MLQPYPDRESSPELILEWLHTDGWTMGHLYQDEEWIVTGFRANQTFRVSGKSLEDAWYQATQQVRAHELSQHVPS